jgi:hypothetical protein
MTDYTAIRADNPKYSDGKNYLFPRPYAVMFHSPEHKNCIAGIG